MNPHDLFNNLDPRQEMNNLNSNRNWVQSTPAEWESDTPYTVSPHPMTGSDDKPFELVGVNIEMNTDDYEISEIETKTSRGRGKGKKTSETGPKRYTPEESMVLVMCYIDVSEDLVIGNNRSFGYSETGLLRSTTLRGREALSSVRTKCSGSTSRGFRRTCRSGAASTPTPRRCGRADTAWPTLPRRRTRYL